MMAKLVLYFILKIESFFIPDSFARNVPCPIAKYAKEQIKKGNQYSVMKNAKSE